METTPHRTGPFLQKSCHGLDLETHVTPVYSGIRQRTVAYDSVRQHTTKKNQVPDAGNKWEGTTDFTQSLPYGALTY